MNHIQVEIVQSQLAVEVASKPPSLRIEMVPPPRIEIALAGVAGNDGKDGTTTVVEGAGPTPGDPGDLTLLLDNALA